MNKNLMKHPLKHEPIVLPSLVVAVIAGVLSVWGIEVSAPAEPVAGTVADAATVLAQILTTAAATAITGYLAARRQNTDSTATREAEAAEIQRQLSAGHADLAQLEDEGTLH